MIRMIESEIPKCIDVDKMDARQLAETLRCFARRLPRPLGFAMLPANGDKGEQCAVYAQDGTAVPFGDYGACDSVFQALFYMLAAKHAQMICNALEIAAEHVDLLESERRKTAERKREPKTCDALDRVPTMNTPPYRSSGVFVPLCSSPPENTTVEEDRQFGERLRSCMFEPWTIQADSEASDEGDER